MVIRNELTCHISPVNVAIVSMGLKHQYSDWYAVFLIWNRQYREKRVVPDSWTWSSSFSGSFLQYSLSLVLSLGPVSTFKCDKSIKVRNAHAHTLYRGGKGVEQTCSLMFYSEQKRRRRRWQRRADSLCRQYHEFNIQKQHVVHGIYDNTGWHTKTRIHIMRLYTCNAVV